MKVDIAIQNIKDINLKSFECHQKRIKKYTKNTKLQNI